VIVRPLPDSLLCIRQLDHAALSGALAGAWGGEMPPLRPREPVVLAIERHDAGWDRPDRSPVLDPDTGQPYSYRTCPLEVALAVAERSVTEVGAADPYAGWLVSRHFASFHAGSEAREARAWVVAQVGHRAELLSRAAPRVGHEALHPHVLEANFDWLQLLDGVSLAACEGWESWSSRETCAGYGEETRTFDYHGVEAGDEPLRVRARLTPWPFEPAKIRATVPAVRIPAGLWDSQEGLARAWRDARPLALEVALTAE
jgi:hypothetical protein